MLHHVSFNALKPDHVSRVLAELLGAVAIRAPAPPFPSGSWLVCSGDDRGSLLEVMPWGAVREPAAPSGAGHDPEMRRHSGTHLLLATPHTVDAVLAIAAREAWPAETGDAGLFRFTKVWIEGAFLIELLSPEHAAAYVAAFNGEGLASLNHKLRQVEAALAARSRPAGFLSTTTPERTA